MGYRGKKLTRDEWIDKYNITDDTIYMVTGCNTFEIKDELKELGAKYFSGLGWFFNKESLPEDIKERFSPDLFVYPIKVNDTFEANGDYINGILDKIQGEIKQIISDRNREKYGESEWVGEPGDRLRNMKGQFVSARFFEGQWGGSFIYTFRVDSNVFIWFSQSVIDKTIEPNDEIILSGTVKQHTEYNGILQTQLSRCIVKKG